MPTFQASEFKAKCLALMDQLAARKLSRIVVTKHGKPVAVLSPPPTPEEAADAFFGFMKGSVEAPEDFDVARLFGAYLCHRLYDHQDRHRERDVLS